MNHNRMIFATTLILVLGGLQVAAWYFNKDGAVFAFTSALIGLIAGSVFGFSLQITKTKKITEKP